MAEKKARIPIIFEVGHHLHKGRRRESNQDSTAFTNFDPAETVDGRAVGIFMVADGMGGLDKGEFASQLATQTALKQLVDDVTLGKLSSDADYQQSVRKAFDLANRVVYSSVNSSEASHSMGTTMVLACLADLQAYIGNVGDSRAYLIREAHMRQITEDHSFVQELLSRGVINKEQARKHPQRNTLRRALGVEDHVKADVFTLEMQFDDRLLLCSDGLTNELDDARIQQIVLGEVSAQAACEALIRAANQEGGHDNSAVLLVHLKGVPEDVVDAE